MSRTPTAWFTDFGQGADAPVRLFAFAHAGGGGGVFHRWGKRLADVHVLAARLPGRESRIAEPACRVLPLLIEALAEQIAPWLDRPFAFYGHSLGGLIAYELAHRLRVLGLRQPERLLVGACRAPDRKSPHPKLYDLDDAGFVQGLQRYGGLQQPVLDSPEILALLLPMLRADFTLAQTPRPPLAQPIVVYSGTRDPLIEADDIAAWQGHGRAGVRVHDIDAGHLFHLSHEAELLSSIAGELAAIAPAHAPRGLDSPSSQPDAPGCPWATSPN